MHRAHPFLIGLLCSSMSGVSWGQSETETLPKMDYGREVLPPESVAVADEGHSFFYNPAGAAFTEPESFSFYQTFLPAGDRPGPGDVGRGIYWSMPTLRFGWQYEATRTGEGHGVLTFSQSKLINPALAFGSQLAFHYFNFTEPARAGLFGLSLGVQARPHRSFSMGVMVKNVLSPLPDAPYDDFRARGQLGLGFRPFGPRFTITADASAYLATLPDDPDISLQSTLGMEPVDGLRLHGSLEWMNVSSAERELVIGMGATFRLGKMQIGDQGFLQASSSGVKGAADSFYVIGSKHAQPTVFQPGGPKGQVWEVKISGKLLPPAPSELLATKPPAIRLLHPLSKLYAVQKLDRARAVLLHIEAHDASLAEMQELRAAVQRVRNSGKRVVAFLERAEARDLYLASACDAVVLHPRAEVLLEPPRRERYYLKSALEQWGVRLETVRREGYKSMPEQYVADQASAEATENQLWILNELLAQYQEGISTGRNLDPVVVKPLFSRGPISAEEALQLKLVDKVAYVDELESNATALFGGSWPVFEDDAPLRPRADVWGPRAHVGIVSLKGEIQSGAQSLPESLVTGQALNANAAIEAINTMREDKTVRAVVLRVDSPGGELFASDELWRAVYLLRKRKPVVVSMSSVAASGGYYLSLPATLVMADPATITGSIGIFALKPELSGLLQKYQVKPMQFESVPGAPDLDNLNRPWTPEERAQIEASITRGYEAFLSKVSEARGIPKEQLLPLAGGRVWTGRQALEHKLIDRLGGLDEAILIARQRGGIPESAPLELKLWPSSSLEDSILESLVGNATQQGLISRLLGKVGGLPASSLQTPSQPRAQLEP